MATGTGWLASSNDAEVLDYLLRHITYVSISGCGEGEKPIASFTLRVPLLPENQPLADWLTKALRVKP